MKSLETRLQEATLNLGDANNRRDRVSAAYWLDETIRLALLIKKTNENDTRNNTRACVRFGT